MAADIRGSKALTVGGGAGAWLITRGGKVADVGGGGEALIPTRHFNSVSVPSAKFYIYSPFSNIYLHQKGQKKTKLLSCIYTLLILIVFRQQ